MQDETHRPIAGQISTAKKKTTLATRDRSFPTSLMELSKMSVPTSAHLCKVEHHPVGAKLSHASANLSLSLSLSHRVFSLDRFTSTRSVLVPPRQLMHLSVSLSHPRFTLACLLRSPRSTTPVVCFEIRRQCRLSLALSLSNSWFAKGVSHPTKSPPPPSLSRADIRRYSRYPPPAAAEIKVGFPIRASDALTLHPYYNGARVRTTRVSGFPARNLEEIPSNWNCWCVFSNKQR